MFGQPIKKKSNNLSRVWVTPETKKKIIGLRSRYPEKSIMDIVEDCVDTKLKAKAGNKNDKLFPNW